MTGAGLDSTPTEPAGPMLAKQLPDYVIDRRIGSGGMGEVFVARHRVDGSRLAVKLLRWPDADSLVRFKREFRALADARHENLVALGELFVEPEGPVFFTMELVEGRPFDEYVRGLTPIGELPNPTRLTRAFRQLAIGVLELHARGCIHRDLKPSNVLVTREGRVVILDFGLISESLDPAGSQPHGILGTPAYMAPEQGRGEVGTAVDAYALGVMLFECLTGERPFQGLGLDVVLAKIDRDAPDPAERVPTIPSELAKLCRRLLATQPSERATVAELLACMSVDENLLGKPALKSAFVGRTEQLAALTRAFEHVEREHERVAVHIRGRSGQGKSALIGRFLDTLAERSERAPMILRGRIYERESVPYKGIDAIIDALRIQLLRLPSTELATLQPRRLAPLARMFPVLGDLWRMDVRAMPDFAPGELREQGLAALREILQRLGDHRTVVVAIDDFQWADVDSARVLTRLLRPPDPPVLLWLITFRPLDEAGESEALQILDEPENRRVCDVREIELGPLSENEALQLAESLLAGREVAEPARLATVVHHAQGSPFYIGQALLADHEETSSVQSLDRLVARRVVTLDPDARDLLGIIAVAGGPIDLALLDSLSPRASRATLAELVRAGLVQRNDESVETAHDRIREVMVGELESAELRDIHQRLALVLEQANAQPEALARHFEAAGLHERAAEWTERAAEQAIAAVAFGRAVELLRRTLDLLPSDVPERRIRVQAALAEQLANLGRGLEASAHFVELAGRTWASDARRHRRRAAELLLARGRVDEGMALFTSTLRELGERLPRGWLAMLGQIVWERLRLAVRGDRFTLRAERDLEPDMLERIDTLYAAERALSGQELVLAFALQSRAFRLALDAGEPRRLVEFHVYESVLAATGGDRRRGERLGQVARELVESLDNRYLEALLEFHRMIFEYFLPGDSSGAAAMRALKVRLEGVPGSQWMQPNLSVWTASSRLQAGDYVNLLRECPNDLALAHARGNPQEIADLSSLLAIARIHTAELEGVRALIDQAHLAWSVPHVAVPDNQIALAEATLRMWEGQFELAAIEAERSLRSLRRWMVMLVLFLRHSLADVCGRAYASLVVADPGNRRARRRARAHARALRRVSDRPHCLGQAAVIEAALHSAAGRDDLARAHWQEAEQQFEKSALEGHLAAARSRRARLVGGPEGDELLARATAYFEAQAIADSDRFVTILAPARLCPKSKRSAARPDG